MKFNFVSNNENLLFKLNWHIYIYVAYFTGYMHTLDIILLVVDPDLGHGSCFVSASSFDELYYLFSGLLWEDLFIFFFLDILSFVD